MFRLNNDGNACGIQFVFNQIGNRLGHSFLNLRASCNFFNDSSQLAESGHSPTRNVANVSGTGEWQQVMFAHASKWNVFHENQFVV